MSVATANYTEKRFEQSLKSGFAPRTRMSVSEWAEKNLVLSPRSTNRAGPYNLDVTPYAKEILDCFSDPGIEKITMMTAAQIAKTTILFAMLGYAIDQDPGPTLLVYPTGDFARDVSRQRIQPLIDDCQALSRHKPHNEDLYQLQEMWFDRMTAWVVGSNSPAQLMSRPVRYVFQDETEEFPVGHCELADKRARTFYNRKLVKCSTPWLVGGEIHKQFLDGDQRKYWVPCPHCGEYQTLKFAQVKFDWCRISEREWDMPKVKQEAHYECECCNQAIGNRHKHDMLRNGEWRKEGINRRHASFQMSALYPIWVTFGEVAEDFLKSKKGRMSLETKTGRTPFQIFINATLGEPWEVTSRKSSEEEVREHCGEYTMNRIIPSPAVAVICTVDVQKDRFYYVIRAWGAGGSSWLLRYGMVETFDQLRIVLDDPYRDTEGNEYRVAHCWIDSGFRSTEVYDFCSKVGATPIKGEHQYRQAGMIAPMKVPDRGIQGFMIDKGQACDHFYDRRLHIRKGDPGYWEIPNDVGGDYLASILSWERQEKEDKYGNPKMTWVSTSKEYEHLADAEIYQEAAAFHFQFAFIEIAEQSQGEAISHTEFTRRDGRGWWQR